MQITIDIPDELSHLIQNKGKSLDVAIIEALGLYVQLEPKVLPLLDTIEALPAPQKWHIYQILSNQFAPQSAEAKAISRLQDQDDPSKWITSMEESEPVDEEALSLWLVQKGYQKGNV